MPSISQCKLGNSSNFASTGVEVYEDNVTRVPTATSQSAPTMMEPAMAEMERRGLEL